VISPWVPLPHIALTRSLGALTWTAVERCAWPNVGARLSESSGPKLALVGSPLHLAAAERARPAVLAYRMGDDLQLFGTVSENERQGELLACIRADAVLTTSPALEHRARRMCAKRIVMVPNGVDIERFRHRTEPPEELASLGRPLIVYAGAIDHWFDWESVLSAAEQQPRWQFVLLGPIRMGMPSVLPRNVHYLGTKPYTEMPAFMAAADLGIVPFRLDDGNQHLSAVHPIKTYEYLAAGLRVVCAKGILAPSAPHVFRYHGPRDFATVLAQALEASLPRPNERPSIEFDWHTITRTMLRDLGF